MHRTTSRRLAVALLAALAPSCTPHVDLPRQLRVQILNTGWVDAGSVHGRRKLVPTLSVALRNTSTARLRMLQVNALFRRVGDQDEWSSTFVTVAGTDGLAPGHTAVVAITAPQGYTSTDPPAAMLSNAQFVDARAELFAKYADTGWSRLGEYRISRELLAR